MYVTSYVICRVSFRCMPNWQLVLGISPQHWDCRDRQTTARRLEGQTEYLINSTIIMTFILLIYQSFFFVEYSFLWYNVIVFVTSLLCNFTDTSTPRNKRSNESSPLYLYCYLWMEQIGLVSIWCPMITILSKICRVIFILKMAQRGFLKYTCCIISPEPE